MFRKCPQNNLQGLGSLYDSQVNQLMPVKFNQRKLKLNKQTIALPPSLSQTKDLSRTWEYIGTSDNILMTYRID
jgi:hypothetical protein